jgi:putative peptidoglycan lipid II flippase
MSVTNTPNPPPPTGRPSGSAGRTTLMVMAFVLLARAMGMVRSVAIAHTFKTGGQGDVADIYNRAFAIPDMMQLLLAGGALSTVFIPVFTEYLEGKKEAEGWKFFGRIVPLVALIALLLVGVLEVAISFPQVAKTLMWLMAPKFEIGKIEAMIPITRILLPAQFFFFVGSIFIAALQAKNRFKITSLSPIVYNLGIVGAAMSQWLRPVAERDITALAWGAVIGAFLGQFLIPLIEILRINKKWNLGWDMKHPGVQKFIQLLLPALLGLGLPQLQFWMMGFFVAGKGDYTALKNANELMQAPIGVFGQAIAMVLFPTLAVLATNNDWSQYRKEVHFGMRRILFLTLPTSLLIAVLAEPIIQVLYANKETYGPEAQAMTTFCLRMYAIGTFAVSAQTILGRGFFAKKDTKTPLRITKWMIALSLVLYTLSSFLLPSEYVYRGLAASTTLVLIINMFLFLTRLAPTLGGLNMKGLGRATLKIMLCALLCAGVAWLALYPLQNALTMNRFIALGALLMASGAGLCAYIAASYFFGVAEIKSVGAMLQRQAKK